MRKLRYSVDASHEENASRESETLAYTTISTSQEEAFDSSEDLIRECLAGKINL